MTTRLIIYVLLLQELSAEVLGWCFYFCPDNSQDETVCAVDVKLGAKLFHGKCEVWKANYCQGADYKLLDMQECLDRHPEVVPDLVAAKKWVQRYEGIYPYFGVRPFRRYLMLFSLLSRLAPPPPSLLAPLIVQYTRSALATRGLVALRSTGGSSYNERNSP